MNVWTKIMCFLHMPKCLHLNCEQTREIQNEILLYLPFKASKICIRANKFHGVSLSCFSSFWRHLLKALHNKIIFNFVGMEYPGEYGPTNQPSLTHYQLPETSWDFTKSSVFMFWLMHWCFPWFLTVGMGITWFFSPNGLLWLA